MPLNPLPRQGRQRLPLTGPQAIPERRDLAGQ